MISLFPSSGAIVATDTVGQNDATIGRAAAAVTSGDGRESATDVVLTAVRQYERHCTPDRTRAARSVCQPFQLLL
ncbi:hypothetical protein E2L06_06795 [Haloterrigena sp. H1]|nr:hypothetical protein E2L06_06795 [Haloterrigena sp. H1]